METNRIIFWITRVLKLTYTFAFTCIFKKVLLLIFMNHILQVFFIIINILYILNKEVLFISIPYKTMKYVDSTLDESS